MKNLKMALIALVYSGFTIAFGQNTSNTSAPPSEKKIKITDASFYGGFMSQNLPIAGSLSDFQKFSPGSVLLKENMEGYSALGDRYDTGFGINGPSSGGIFGAFLGLSLKETEKSMAQLRCGISMTGININNYLSKKESVPYDTLTSSQTGQTTYYDSTTYQSYSMTYTAKQLQLDVSLIYRIYPASRWSLYGGIGINAGTSLNAYTDVTYSKTLVLPGNTEYNYNYNEYITERTMNKNIQEYAAYLPLGLDFRVGKKREFLKQIHVFMESRPYVSMLNIPELGMFSSTGVKNTFGVRVTI